MKKLFALSICLIVALSACIPAIGKETKAIDPAAAVQTAIAGTKAVEDAVATSVAETAAARQQTGGGGEQNPPLAATTEASPPTPTNIPIPTATIKSNANCRSGPAANFDFIVLLTAGESGKVIGQNAEFGKTWYQLELSDGKQCWVSSDAVDISGDASSVKEVASPPTPSPVPPASKWAGKWTIWQNQCYTNDPDCESSFTMNWAMTSNNVITGIYTVEGCTYTDVLTVSADGMRADGTENSNCGNWEVHLVMDPGLNQFRGRWNMVGYTAGDGYYCGARNGASKPSPTRP